MESEDLLRKVKEEPQTDEDDDLNDDMEGELAENRQDVAETLLESLAQSTDDGTVIKAEPVDEEDVNTSVSFNFYLFICWSLYIVVEASSGVLTTFSPTAISEN